MKIDSWSVKNVLFSSNCISNMTPFLSEINCFFLLLFMSGALNVSLRLFLVIESFPYLCVPDVDILKYSFMVKALNFIIVLTWRWTQVIMLYRYNEMLLYSFSGYAVAQLDDTLRYKLEGNRFDTRWGH